jgi:hypothetical protein
MDGISSLISFPIRILELVNADNEDGLEVTLSFGLSFGFV